MLQIAYKHVKTVFNPYEETHNKIKFTIKHTHQKGTFRNLVNSSVVKTVI